MLAAQVHGLDSGDFSRAKIEKCACEYGIDELKNRGHTIYRSGATRIILRDAGESVLFDITTGLESSIKTARDVILQLKINQLYAQAASSSRSAAYPTTHA